MVNNFCLRPLVRIHHQSQLLQVSSFWIFGERHRPCPQLYPTYSNNNNRMLSSASFNNNNKFGRNNFLLAINSENKFRSTTKNSKMPYSQHFRPPGALPPYLRIDSKAEAHELVAYLLKHEREHLRNVLNELSGTTVVVEQVDGAKPKIDDGKITPEQTKMILLSSILPFIGFGILDNLLMIIAGEYIDNTMGVLFGLSTMAAAGLGNILSDIAGVGSAHYVEFMVSKFFGVKQPALTAAQWDSSKVRWTTNAGRCIGLVIGCLIGMFPLLFFDETGKQEKKLQAKHAN